jgi:hypothetical protein
VDQLHIGAYGVLTMEAMSLGKPVLCYIRDDLFRPVYGDMPIVNANPDTIKDKLRQTISDFEMRREFGERARAFVEQHHDLEKVAAQAAGIYERVMAASPAFGGVTADIDFLLEQYTLLLQAAEKKRGVKGLMRKVWKTAAVRRLTGRTKK